MKIFVFCALLLILAPPCRHMEIWKNNFLKNLRFLHSAPYIGIPCRHVEIEAKNVSFFAFCPVYWRFHADTWQFKKRQFLIFSVFALCPVYWRFHADTWEFKRTIFQIFGFFGALPLYWRCHADTRWCRPRPPGRQPQTFVRARRKVFFGNAFPTRRRRDKLRLAPDSVRCILWCMTGYGRSTSGLAGGVA